MLEAGDLAREMGKKDGGLVEKPSPSRWSSSSRQKHQPVHLGLKDNVVRLEYAMAMCWRSWNRYTCESTTVVRTRVLTNG